MVKSFGSENSFRGVMDSIANDPNFLDFRDATGHVQKSLASRAGLKLTDLTKLSSREESMMSTWAEKIPGIGKGVRASNRAYIAFLNKLRADNFNSLVKQMEKTGLDPRNDNVLLGQLGDFINNATGRGDLGAFEDAAVGLSSVFFSPRLIASRVNMLGNTARSILTPITPKQYVFANPFIRKQYLKSMAATATTWTTLAGLAKLGGASVNTDPNNADFMKIKIGNTRLDPGGGFQQYLVLFNRIANNSFTSSTTGKREDMGRRFGGKTGDETIWDFVQNKMAPIPATAFSFFGRSTERPFEVGDRVARLFTPMIIQDLSEILQTDPELIPVAAVGGLGLGVQTYGERGRGKRLIPESVFPRKMDIKLPAWAK
jgi:hypothetical protein